MEQGGSLCHLKLLTDPTSSIAAAQSKLNFGRVIVTLHSFESLVIVRAPNPSYSEFLIPWCCLTAVFVVAKLDQNEKLLETHAFTD